jgi:formyl-CoA transferase
VAGPLAGLKVLELGTLIAGPFAARMFAEFGADVIKVEDPRGGDPIRNWRFLHEGTSLWWYVQSRNKRSITLNLKDPRGQAIARSLALDADVIIENYRPGVLEKWGLGYEALLASNPATIMVRISGYGQTGPMRDMPGFGAIGESMGGIRYVSGHPDRPPVRIGISIGDSIAALHAVIGALMALRHRDATGRRGRGEGQIIDVALYEAVFNMMESTVPEYDRFGVVRERTGGALGHRAVQYLCLVDGAIVVAGNGDEFSCLMTAIGRPDWLRIPHSRITRGVLNAPPRSTTQFSLGAANADRRGAGGAEGGRCVVHLPKLALKSGGFGGKRSFASVFMPRKRKIPENDASFDCVVLSQTPGATHWLGPRLGQHTDEVLQALGHDATAIEALRREGVI